MSDALNWLRQTTASTWFSLCPPIPLLTVICSLDCLAICSDGSHPITEGNGSQLPYFHSPYISQNILQTLAFPSFPVLQNAKQDLAAILSRAAPPDPSPRITNVIDPNIIRNLVSSIPMRNVTLPPQKEAWSAWKIWLEQWGESRSLIGAEKLWSVKVSWHRRFKITNNIERM